MPRLKGKLRYPLIQMGKTKKPAKTGPKRAKIEPRTLEVRWNPTMPFDRRLVMLHRGAESKCLELSSHNNCPDGMALGTALDLVAWAESLGVEVFYDPPGCGAPDWRPEIE